MGVASRRSRRSPMARRRCRGRRLLHGLRLDHQRAARHDDPQDVPAVPRRRPLAVGRDAVDAHRSVHPRRHGLWNADRSRRRTVLVRTSDRSHPDQPGPYVNAVEAFDTADPDRGWRDLPPDSRAAARRHGHRRHRRPCLHLRRATTSSTSRWWAGNFHDERRGCGDAYVARSRRSPVGGSCPTRHSRPRDGKQSRTAAATS